MCVTGIVECLEPYYETKESNRTQRGTWPLRWHICVNVCVTNWKHKVSTRVSDVGLCVFGTRPLL